MATSDPVIPPPRPALALPPRPALRRGLWALPLVLSLAFVAVVLAWLRSNEQSEHEEQRAELISDALTLQSQFSARIERETALLAEVGERLDRHATTPDGFVAMPEVQQGLHRFWIGLTWLDTSNRIQAHLPDFAPRPDLPALAGAGLSAHLSTKLASGGTLVARYSPI